MFLRRLHGPVLLGFPTCSHLTDFILLFKTLKAYRRKTELSKKRPITKKKKKNPTDKALKHHYSAVSRESTALGSVQMCKWFKCFQSLPLDS